MIKHKMKGNEYQSGASLFAMIYHRIYAKSKLNFMKIPSIRIVRDDDLHSLNL